MLAIGRALMARPKLMMLDEPSMGLAPLVVKDIFAILQRIRAEGTTVLLVEQNARGALRIADRGGVLETGRIVLEGTAEELLANRDVQRAYLGSDLDAENRAWP
jgi:branched-chain amino acid transport system ATP-binding protein